MFQKEQQHFRQYRLALCENTLQQYILNETCVILQSDGWYVEPMNPIKMTAVYSKSQCTIYRYTLFSNTFQFTRKYFCII